MSRARIDNSCATIYPPLTFTRPRERIDVSYNLKHLANDVLARDLVRHAAHDRDTLAMLLAYIAEFDARHLYLPAGYPSMFAYCVEQLHMSEDATYNRIFVARAARKFTGLFTAIAEGRLHLAGARMLVPYMNVENANELIVAAANLKRVELEAMLAGRYPAAEPLRLDEGISALAAPQVVDLQSPDAIGLVPGQVQVETRTTPPVVKPIAAQRFSLQVTLDGETHAKLRRAQDLLSHATRDIAEVIHRALVVLIEELEKRKFGKTDHPRGQRPSARARNIPAHVKRAVYQRDAGRCAFVALDGTRCKETQGLEFDHIVPIARGGRATAENTRLLCRPHNQHMAEEIFGMEFMEGKRGG